MQRRRPGRVVPADAVRRRAPAVVPRRRARTLSRRPERRFGYRRRASRHRLRPAAPDAAGESQRGAAAQFRRPEFSERRDGPHRHGLSHQPRPRHRHARHPGRRRAQRRSADRRGAGRRRHPGARRERRRAVPEQHGRARDGLRVRPLERPHVAHRRDHAQHGRAGIARVGRRGERAVRRRCLHRRGGGQQPRQPADAQHRLSRALPARRRRVRHHGGPVAVCRSERLQDGRELRPDQQDGHRHGRLHAELAVGADRLQHDGEPQRRRHLVVDAADRGGRGAVHTASP